MRGPAVIASLLLAWLQVGSSRTDQRSSRSITGYRSNLGGQTRHSCGGSRRDHGRATISAYIPGLPHQMSSSGSFGQVDRTRPSRNGLIRMASTLSPPKVETHVRLHVTDLNKRGEEGIPVVILHGLLGQGRNFRSWGAALHDRLARPRRVLIPDLRNHGSSGHAEAMTYKDMAADVFALLEKEGIDKAIVVGHSMGGKVAAAAGLIDPERIAGLVVMDIAPVSYTITDGTNWADTNRLIEMLSHVPVSDIREKAEADLKLRELGLEDAGLRSFVLMNLVKDQAAAEPRFNWQINVSGIQRSLPQIAAFDLPEAQQARYPHKTLFLNGGKSKYLRAAHLSEIARLFPIFSLATIREASHWVHADAPEETLAIVQRYLDEEMHQ